MLFNGADNQKNCPFPLGIWAPSNTWFFGSTRITPKRHLDRFSRFRSAHERDQQTDRQTDHATACVALSRYR